MAKAKKEKSSGSSSNNKNLILYVTAFGALLMILVYVFVFQKLTMAADEINTSNRALNQRVNELKVYYDNRYIYMEDTQKLEQLLDELLTEYPADARRGRHYAGGADAAQQRSAVPDCQYAEG